MKKEHQLVWVGFSDGAPHVYECEQDGAGCVAVYRTRRQARVHYQDVRRATLVIERRSPSATAGQP